jgi:HPr kinase/phosphorylase
VTPAQDILHATCVAVDGRGVLILGPSGSGKSALALRLLSLGARLVADDRTEVTVTGGRLVARCPVQIAGLIEARGVGLLRAPAVDQAEVALVATLAKKRISACRPHDRSRYWDVRSPCAAGAE